MTPQREERLTACLRRASKVVRYLGESHTTAVMRADAEKGFRECFVEAVEIVLEDRKERATATAKGGSA